MPAYPGRPREFKHKMREELINHVGHGATVEEAANIVGVSLRTVQREAKHNEFFHHDLQLALHSAEPDPERLMKRAARTHWRAAAWMLERKDPDRYAKRPPNSCGPDKLFDIMAFLIETALQAIQPDQREGVYRKMQDAADRAFDALMPDQHESRRWTNALANHPMPLLNHEFVKRVLEPDNNSRASARHLANDPALRLRNLLNEQLPPAAAADGQPPRPPKVRRWQSPDGFKLQDSDMMDAEWRYYTPEEEEAYLDAQERNAEIAAAVREVRAKDEAAARRRAERAKSPSNSSAKTAPAPAAAASVKFPQPTPAASTSPAVAAPPNGGIMSPKMSAATQLAPTECQPAERQPTERTTTAAHAIDVGATDDPPAGESDRALRSQHPFSTLLEQLRARRQRAPSARAA